MKTGQRQTVFDLALQFGGDAEAAFDIAKANGLSMSADLVAGIELQPVAAVDADVVALYKAEHIAPAGGSEKHQDDFKEGIGFWQIEFEFEIQ